MQSTAATHPSGGLLVCSASTGLSEDGDLYVRSGELPSGDLSTGANADCVSWQGGNSTETCGLNNVGVTSWCIGVYGNQFSPYQLLVETNQSRAWTRSKNYPVSKSFDLRNR